VAYQQLIVLLPPFLVPLIARLLTPHWSGRHAAIAAGPARHRSHAAARRAHAHAGADAGIQWMPDSPAIRLLADLSVKWERQRGASIGMLGL
jgi:hypothetical protein